MTDYIRNSDDFFKKLISKMIKHTIVEGKDFNQAVIATNKEMHELFEKPETKQAIADGLIKLLFGE